MAVDDDDDDDNGYISERTMKEMQVQARAQKKAAKIAAEQNKNIISTSEPRTAKKNAMANPPWLQETKRRPAQAQAQAVEKNSSEGNVPSSTQKRKRSKSTSKETQSKASKRGKKQPTTQEDISSDDEPVQRASSEPPQPLQPPSWETANSGSDGEQPCSNAKTAAMFKAKLTAPLRHQSPPLESDLSSESYKASDEDHSDDEDDDGNTIPYAEVQELETARVVVSSQAHPHSTTRTSSPDPPARVVPTQSRAEVTAMTDHLRGSDDSQRASQSKKLSKRDQVFQNECPEVVKPDVSAPNVSKHRKKSTMGPSLSSTSETIQGNNNRLVADWPSYAQLGGAGLKEQNDLVRHVCNHAIKIAQQTLVTTHAWPEHNRLTEYRQEILNAAAKALERKFGDERFAVIRTRIKRDGKFTMALGKLVVDRLARIRGPVRLKGLDHIAVFQLGIGEACAQRAQVLMANDTYIYPGKWGTDENNKPFWIVRSKEIYLNAGLLEVIKESFFATPTSFGYKFTSLYKSSITGPLRQEPELSAPLVALAATGLYAGLHAWQTGVKVTVERFEGDTFKSVYDRHLGYLKSIKDENSIAYHVLMSKIYSAVVTSDSSGTNASKPQGSALAVADLSEFV